jgi:hypothetical protein
MLPKKYLSRCEKRKKKKREEELKKTQQGALDKFIFRARPSHDNLNINKSLHDDIGKNTNW